MHLDDIEKKTTTKRDHRGPYTTEQGVMLKYKKVPTDAVRKAWTAIQVPKPPMVYIEDHGRDEPNPADPGYLNELSQYNNKVNLVIHTIYFMQGVEIFSIPDNIPGPESKDWYEGMEEYWDIPQGKLALKAAWLMYYALNDTEKEEILGDLMVLTGLVPEEKVEEAVDSFRDSSVSETNHQVPVTPGSTDRHTLP